jgi:hypothetical protein
MRVADNEANEQGHAVGGHKHTKEGPEERRKKLLDSLPPVEANGCFAQDLHLTPEVLLPRSRKEMLKNTEGDAGDYHVTRIYKGHKVKGKTHVHIRKRRSEHHPPGTPKKRTYRHKVQVETT